MPFLRQFFFFFFNFFLLFIYYFYFWLCWVFVSVRGLSPVAASGGHSSSRCVGLSLSRPLLLWSTGSRRAGSVVVAHGPSSSAACGIFPDQGSNPCPLHWQADSQPLRHQGSPKTILLEHFQVQAKLKKYRHFPDTPRSHTCIATTIINIPHESATFVTIDGHIIFTQNLQFTLQFILHVEHSTCLDKCKVTCIFYPYGVIQNIFTALKFLCNVHNDYS